MKSPSSDASAPGERPSEPPLPLPPVEAGDARRNSLLDLEDPRVRRGLRLSLWDGVFATVMVGVTETFGVPAALRLAVPALAIALLGSLPLFLGSSGQLVLARSLGPDRSRRTPVVAFVFAQSVLLLVCAVAGFAAPSLASWVFLAAFVGFGVSGNLPSGLWISWMRDLTPQRLRGRLFATRNRALVVVQLTCAVSLGLVARRYTSNSAPWSFFCAIFCLAAGSRLLSGIMLAFQYEPARSLRPASLRPPGPRGTFVSFCVASALMQGATAISGPFFNVWFLSELKFDFLTFTLCGAATLLGSFAMLPLWGHVADRIGSFRLLTLGAVLVSLVPLPYLFVRSPHAIWALNCYSGLAWSAYNLANFNVLLETVGTRDAEREIALAMAISAAAVLVCGVFGGFMATHAPAVAGSRLRTLFLLSAVCRGGVVLYFLKAVRPARQLPAVSALDTFNEFPAYRVGMGVLRAAFRAFRRQ